MDKYYQQMLIAQKIEGVHGIKIDEEIFCDIWTGWYIADSAKDITKICQRSTKKDDIGYLLNVCSDYVNYSTLKDLSFR